MVDLSTISVFLLAVRLLMLERPAARRIQTLEP